MVTPVVENGAIVDTIIIDSGSGYRQVTSAINVISSGSGATFEANINVFSINNIERIVQAEKLNPDDGIIIPSLTLDRGLQYSHGFVGRELRRKVLSTSIDNDGNTLYRDDIDNDTASTLYHSPIVGWAYDGHPIYGPYGYADKEGGAIKRLNSGYELRIKSDRPSMFQFPSGIFFEDYVYVGNGDLDIHNGRYCKTPEFSKWSLCTYFCTINDVQEFSGPFNEFSSKPRFPYKIGPSFKSKPIEYNFDHSFQFRLY